MPTVQVDGAQLTHWTDGDGPPVLYIHGVGNSGEMWRPYLADLAADHRVITYNRRGYPGSPGQAGHWRDHGDDAAALIEALDAAPAAVIGFSGGAIVALDLALRRPELMSALVLLDPAVHVRDNKTPALMATFVKLQVQRRLGRRERGLAAWFKHVTSYSTGGSTWDRMPEERRRMLIANADGVFADMDLGDDSHVAYDRLSGIESPVTIVECALSPSFLRKSCAALREALPAAEVITLENSGHVAYADRPDELNAALRRAVRGAVAA